MSKEMDLLSACKMAYRKHHLNDDSIGWDELSSCLLDALCNTMGDKGYQEWVASQQTVPRDLCLVDTKKRSGRPDEGT